MTNTEAIEALEALEAALTDAHRLADVGGVNITDTEIVGIVHNVERFRTAELDAVGSHGAAVGSTWDLGNGEILTITGRYDGETWVAQAHVEMSEDRRHELHAEARVGIVEALDQAVEALVAVVTYGDCQLSDIEQVIEHLQLEGISATTAGSGDTEEFGVEVEERAGRVVLSAWCWDPRHEDPAEVGDTLFEEVDAELAIEARDLADNRRALAAAETSFAETAAAAQAAGTATWQDIARMLGSQHRQGAKAWVERHQS